MLRVYHLRPWELRRFTPRELEDLKRDAMHERVM